MGGRRKRTSSAAQGGGAWRGGGRGGHCASVSDGPLESGGEKEALFQAENREVFVSRELATTTELFSCFARVQRKERPGRAPGTAGGPGSRHLQPQRRGGARRPRKRTRWLLAPPGLPLGIPRATRRAAPLLARWAGVDHTASPSPTPSSGPSLLQTKPRVEQLQAGRAGAGKEC